MSVVSVTFAIIEALVERDKRRPAPMRLVKKLNMREHLRPKGADAMKVKRAAQILSGSVERALRYERMEQYRQRLKQCYAARRAGARLPYTRAQVLDAQQTKEMGMYALKFNRARTLSVNFD